MSSENLTTPSPNDDCMGGYPETYYEYEIPAVLAVAIGITSDVIIVYTMAKFENLKTQSNRYILNWCICNILLLISIPTCFHMFAITCFIPLKLFIIIFDATLCFTLGNMIFTSLLVSDWCICTYRSRTCVTKCRQYSKFITLIAWAVILAFCLVTVIFAANDISFPVVLISLSLGSAAEVLLVIFIQVVRFMKPTSSKATPLFLVTTYMLFWAPYWFYMFHHSTYIQRASVSYQVAFPLMTIGFLNPAIVLYLMYRYDETFKGCLVVLCKSRQSRHIELEGKHRGSSGGRRQSAILI